MSKITKEKVLKYHKNGKIGIDLVDTFDREKLRCLIYGCPEEE